LSTWRIGDIPPSGSWDAPAIRLAPRVGCRQCIHASRSACGSGFRRPAPAHDDPSGSSGIGPPGPAASTRPVQLTCCRVRPTSSSSEIFCTGPKWYQWERRTTRALRSNRRPASGDVAQPAALCGQIVAQSAVKPSVYAVKTCMLPYPRSYTSNVIYLIGKLTGPAQTWYTVTSTTWRQRRSTSPWDFARPLGKRVWGSLGPPRPLSPKSLAYAVGVGRSTAVNTAISRSCT
jgi:hypothetical protein